VSPTSKTAPSEAAPALIAVQLCIEAHIPVMLRGGSGSTKSATVKALARALDRKLWTICLSTREPHDQGGLPAVVTNQLGEKRQQHLPPQWASELCEAGGGIVFFDEITAASAQVMNSALRVIQDGMVGDSTALPAATSFVLAGNTPQTNVGTIDLTAGVANRSCHVRWMPPYASWRRGMLTGFAPLSITPLPATWKDGVQAMRELVIDFLDAEPTMAYAEPEDPQEQGRAWPSYRTWELTATALAAAKAAGHQPTGVVARLLVGGLVGEAAQRAFASWLTRPALPSLSSLFAAPQTVALPMKQDELIATLAMVADGWRPPEGQLGAVEQRYQAAWTIVGRVLSSNQPGLGIAAARALMAEAPEALNRKPAGAYAEGLKLAGKHLRRAGVDHGRAR